MPSNVKNHEWKSYFCDQKLKLNSLHTYITFIILDHLNFSGQDFLFVRRYWNLFLHFRKFFQYDYSFITFQNKLFDLMKYIPRSFFSILTNSEFNRFLAAFLFPNYCSVVLSSLFWIILLNLPSLDQVTSTVQQNLFMNIQVIYELASLFNGNMCNFL